MTPLTSRWTRILAASLAWPVLIACVRPPPARPPVELIVAGGPDGCVYLAEGRTLTVGTLERAARKWRKRGVRIVGGTQAPYRCAGHAIYLLQRAGHRVGGFGTEAPR